MSSKCPKIGIKIRESNNEYHRNPFSTEKQEPLKQKKEQKKSIYLEKYQTELDLNIDNYTQDELYKLLGIYGQQLNEDVLKSIRHVVLKTHPDKSGLSSDYFIFFSKAYDRLCFIYKFQNKTTKTAKDFQEEHVLVEKDKLDSFFESNQHLKKNNEFNSWFNTKFQECNNHDEKEDTGYGKWLRSNEDITESNSLQDLEKKKKSLQQLIVHTGVLDYESSSLSCLELDEVRNFTSNTFTDVKQAYTESVIPVTEQDLQNVKQFKNLNEYQNYRDKQQSNVKMVSKQESEFMLQKKKQLLDAQSERIAYKWCQDNDRSQVANDKFQSEIRRINYK